MLLARHDMRLIMFFFYYFESPFVPQKLEVRISALKKTLNGQRLLKKKCEKFKHLIT